MSESDLEERQTLPGPSRNKYLTFFIVLLGGLFYFISQNEADTIVAGNSSILEECPTQIFASLRYECSESQQTPIISIKGSGLRDIRGFLLLQGQFISEQVSSSTYQVEVSSFRVAPDGSILQSIHLKKKEDIVMDCSKTETGVSCAPQIFEEIENVQGNDYIVVINFLNLDIKESEMKMKFSFLASDPINNIYAVIINWGLFGLSLFSFIIYTRSLSAISSDEVSQEQYYVIWIGFISILLNFPLSFFVNSIRLSYAGVLFNQVIQSTFLLLFWLTLLKRLALAPNGIPNSAFRTSQWIAYGHMIGASLLLGFFLSDDLQETIPLGDKSDRMAFKIGTYYLLGLLVLVTIWSLGKSSKIIAQWQSLTWRDKTSLSFTFFYIICFVASIVTSSFELLNVVGSYSSLFSSLATVYIIMLQVIYALFEEELVEVAEKQAYDLPGKFQELNESKENKDGDFPVDSFEIEDGDNDE